MIAHALSLPFAVLSLPPIDLPPTHGRSPTFATAMRGWSETRGPAPQRPAAVADHAAPWIAINRLLLNRLSAGDSAITPGIARQLVVRNAQSTAVYPPQPYDAWQRPHPWLAIALLAPQHDRGGTQGLDRIAAAVSSHLMRLQGVQQPAILLGAAQVDASQGWSDLTVRVIAPSVRQPVTDQGPHTVVVCTAEPTAALAADAPDRPAGDDAGAARPPFAPTHRIQLAAAANHALATDPPPTLTAADFAPGPGGALSRSLLSQAAAVPLWGELTVMADRSVTRNRAQMAQALTSLGFDKITVIPAEASGLVTIEAQRNRFPG